ncbi:MAG: hypothetical protein HQL01_05085 [Nitrospirae bacterium]|nr:hypothetical protein [Nitrospirota bacterium]
MTYSEAFYKGFDTANKNLLLALVHMAATYIMAAGLVIVLIIPVAVAAVSFGGVMFTSLKDINIDNIGQLFLGKYLALVVVVAAIAMVYVLIATLVGLYIYGGSCGMLARGIKEERFKFTMEGFFAEARRLFGPVLGFTSVVGLVALVVLVLIVASVFPLSYIIESLESANQSLSTFLMILSILAGAVIFFFMFAGMFAVTLYGTAIVVFKGMPAMQSFNEAVRLILKRPAIFLFFLVCAIIYFAVNVMILGGMFSVVMIPVIGTILMFPYQLLIQGVQYYLGILFIAVLFSYYTGIEGGQLSSTTFDTSTAATDTSLSAFVPETSPHQQGDKEEGVH